MNKKVHLLLAVFALLCWCEIAAQPVNPPCPTPPPPGAENCPASCVYCDFDGYMGINNGTPSGGNTVCGAIAIHNDQWFGFTAGTTDITITIFTENCEDGNGMQAAFFDDCSDPDAIVCNPGSAGGAGVPLVLNYSGFTIGETYFLMLDGWSGDVCDFEIEISGGTIDPGAPDNATQPQGPNQVCPGAQVVYTIPDVFAAGSYIWSAPPGSLINGLPSPQNIDAPEGAMVTITFGNSGGNVCVQADNACYAPTPPACLPVTNQPIPNTIRQPIVVCYEDTPFTWDEEPFPILSNPGTFTLTSTPYDSWLGCDSVVKQTITIKQIAPTPLGTKYICAGTCFQLAGDNYCDPGLYNVNFDSFQGCDSLVNFTVAVLDPVAVIPPPANPIDCNSSGVVLQSTGSTPLGQASYSWQNVNWQPLAGTPTYNATLTGTYYLVVTTTGGGVQCRDTAMVTVTGNTTAPGATATSAGNINCIASQTTLNGSSQTNGVTYTWTGPGITPANQFQQNPTVDQPGVYVLTVKNPVNGCTSTATITVNGDITPPAAGAAGGLITCTQTSVTIDGSTNVANPVWTWTGPGINAGNMNQEDPNVNVSGTYTVVVRNPVNGCTNTATAVVDVNNTIPSASAGPDQTLTCLLTNTALQGSGNSGNGQPVSFSWTGPNGFVSNIPQPSVNEAGTYVLTVMNAANGCVKHDTVVIAANQALPTASAGADSTITCAQPAVFLLGGASSNGPDFTALWSGPGINPGNSNQYNPEVDAPGDYVLVITNITNGCTATDLVTVGINTSLPTANAGNDLQITCTNPGGVTLNGSGFPTTVTYLWTGPGIGANNETQQSPTVTLAGTYDVVVTNPANGCTATDQTIVTQDANVPVAAGGPDQTLNCSVFSVNFDASGSTSGAGIEYEWSGPGISGGNVNTQSPSGLNVPGVYTLTVTNTLNNCINTDIVVIEIDTIAPVADAGNPLVLNCYNNATDTLNASGSSLGSIFNVLWQGPGIDQNNQNSVNPVLSNQSGTYSLTITNTQNTCTATDQVLVTLDLAAPTADAGTDKIIDCVVTSTNIGGASSTGTNFTYLWTGPSIDASNEALASPVVDQPGTYTIVVTNTTNGCTSSNDVIVDTDAVYPAALAGNDGLITCAAPDATLDGSASSTGANFQTLWTGPGINASNQNLPAPVVTVPGDYIIAVTNLTNSCVSRDTVHVDENTVVPNADAGADAILNCMVTSLSLDGSLSTTGTTIEYIWTGPGINASNEGDQNPPIDQPGTYDLIVIDNDNGCLDTDAVVVSQDTIHPVASAGPDGLLTCTILDQVLNGSGSSVGPNIVYVWQGPGINSSNFNLQSPTVTQNGTYTVTVSNNINHCFTTDQVFVDLNETQPVIAAGPDRTLTCAITSVQLDATQSQPGPNISYSWDGPSIASGTSSPTPTVNGPGVYVLTITDSTNGCTNVDAVNVNEDIIKPTVLAGLDLTITCANATTGVTLNSTGSDSGPNFTYLWTGPGITPTTQDDANPTVLSPGTYILNITNTLNGCVAADTASVDASQDLPVASAGPDRVIDCNFTDATLDASGSTANGGTLTFVWQGPGINPGNVNGDMPTVTLAGTYTVTVQNPVTGCQASDQVVVVLDQDPPVVTATNSGEITCQDPVVSVTSTTSEPGSTFLWEGPDVNNFNKDDQNIQVDVEGLYVITVTAPNGCTSTASTIVTVNEDVPEGQVESAVLNCLNGGVSIISGEVVSPPGSTFTWTGNGIGTQTTNEVTVTQPGVYTFTIFAPNGCEREYEVTVEGDFVSPIAEAQATETIDCNTSEVTINGTGSSVGPNFSYTWTAVQNGNIVSGANTLTPLVNRAGDYQLLVYNNLNGCSATETVTVDVDPEVPSGFNVEVSNIRCFGDTNGSINVIGVQGGTQPFIFSLSGSTGSTTNQYTGLTAGEYTLSLEDANGCSLDTVITIGEPGQLQVELGPDIEISLGEYATVAAQIQSTLGLESLEWNYAPGGCDTIPFCETFTYQPFDSYRHTIEVTDVNGCVERDEILVIVQKKREIYVPNIFNPNSSDNNILTVFAGADVANIKSFRVYDRWGDAVFAVDDLPKNDFTRGWDGTVRGQEGAVAVYVWYCEVEFIDGETKLFKGDVTLMR